MVVCLICSASPTTSLFSLVVLVVGVPVVVVVSSDDGSPMVLGASVVVTLSRRFGFPLVFSTGRRWASACAARGLSIVFRGAVVIASAFVGATVVRSRLAFRAVSHSFTAGPGDC